MSNSSEENPVRLDPALVQDIFTFFDLGEAVENERIGSGYANQNYTVQSTAGGSDYVIRLRAQDNHDLLANEVHVQEALRVNNISAVYYIVGQNGERAYRNDKVCANVSKKLPGVCPRPASAPACYAIGETLAEFHTTLDSLPYAGPTYLLSEVGARRIIEEVTDTCRQARVTIALDEASIIFNSGLPQGVIHGDLHVGNVLIQEEGKRPQVSILDTEAVTENILLLDLARSIPNLCVTDGTLDLTKTQCYLEGYARKRSLYRIEAQRMPSIIKFGAIVVAAWCYKNGYDPLGDGYMRVATDANKKEEAIIAIAQNL